MTLKFFAKIRKLTTWNDKVFVFMAWYIKIIPRKPYLSYENWCLFIVFIIVEWTMEKLHYFIIFMWDVAILTYLRCYFRDFFIIRFIYLNWNNKFNNVNCKEKHKKLTSKWKAETLNSLIRKRNWCLPSHSPSANIKMVWLFSAPLYSLVLAVLAERRITFECEERSKLTNI